MIQHGPFTPQECDRIVTWLQEKEIEFSLTNDEEVEKSFTSNDGPNLLRRAEFRTETFLAQQFYVEIPYMSSVDETEFRKRFLRPEEVLPASLTPVTAEDEFALRTGALKSARQKRYWARILAAGWILAALYTFYSYLRRG